MSSKGTSPTATSGGAALEPERRFVEFQDEGPWATVPLASVAKISTEKVRDNTCIPMSITSGVGLVSQMEKFGRVIAGDSYKNYLLLKKHDFAYNKSATKEYPEGFIALYAGEKLAAVPNSIFTCFRIKGESPSPQYLNYLFLGNLHGRWLRKFIEVGARAHGSLSINDSDLMALPVPVPAGSNSLKEQQKIADCLDSVDALITAQGRKVEALRGHKKGLMQQLFPQEGETQPRLRFPEFERAGEWEGVPLSKMVNGLDAGVSVNSGDRPAMNNEIGVLKTSAVTSGIFEPLENKVVFDDEEISRVKEPVHADTIIISRMNTPALVGASAYVRNSLPNIFLPDRLWAAKPRRGTSMRFLAFILGSDRGRAALSSLAGGSSGSMKNIAKSDILAILLTVPSPPEQQRIADCLTSLDDLIAAEMRKLDTLRTHKKGLMQQLFPRVGEADA
ncbi:restriction endonuclease subunit S [Magnetospirillum sp. 64-120]|uniref:restriction endonuclease subunit S n=1 Tax=Magnetospirillum sp. 64-120 TaxID=1895778 RepID=UPI00092B1D29|nr:restriction endonuclease subunit S [Magnetospirillum sp. 64-120]OJX68434.1 MAG: hypothetical protein BGO92_18560 [Magnetospirillum sp. 64-120]